jgi:hypothetical protein
MTRLETILTALLIGSVSMATAAVAQPDRGYDYGRGGEYAPYGGQGHHQRGWFALGQPVGATGSRQFINANGQSARAIRLQMFRGKAYVQQIAVQLENGQTQVQQVGRWMSAHRDSNETIDLGFPSPVRRVIVYTAQGGSAAYQILAT